MEKFIPYEKLSKKEKRKLDHAQRTTWGSLNPITRKPDNSRAYNRRKAQSWKKDFPNSVLFFVLATFVANATLRSKKHTRLHPHIFPLKMA